jgi:hypothetical protein
MLMRNSNSTALRSWWAALGFFCIVLLLFSGMVQVVHSHPLGKAQQDECSLCVTAHLSFSVTQAALSATPHFVALGQVAGVSSRHVHSSLQISFFNRPPPTQAFLA